MAQSKTTIRRGKAPTRWPRYAVLALLAAGGSVLAWQWPGLSAQAQVGTAYGARVACACRFIGGRSLESCEEDFVEGMELVGLSEDESSVTASVPLVASATAHFDEANGCQLEAWED